MDKISVYQLFLRVFGNKNTTNSFYGTLLENGTGKFSSIDLGHLQSLKAMGLTHIWYTGVIEHATMVSLPGAPGHHPQVVKGIAGSPYAITDYYDVNAYLADAVEHRMEEFEALVERTHAAGLKVIIDFVPNHVARQYASDVKPDGVKDFGEDDDANLGFHPNNNFYYIPGRDFVVPDGVNPPVAFEHPYHEYPAKATGNDVFSAEPTINDWFETVKVNYGVDYQGGGHGYFSPVPDTWEKMLHILLFWVEKGVDGFRCDMAEMVPVSFWNYAISSVKAKYPSSIFIAEIYNPGRYREYLVQGKFDYLYDKVGLYDALRRLIEGKGNAMDITSVWQRESGDFSNRMLRFLENHDEHRIAAKEFAGDPSKALAAMMLSATLHAGPVMIYGGQEFGVKPTAAEGFQGDDGRTTIFDFWGLPEVQDFLQHKAPGTHAALWHFYERLLHFVQENEAVYKGHFHDLHYLNSYDKNSIYSYLRYTDRQMLLFVYNFDLERDREVEINLPENLLKRTRMTFLPLFEPGVMIEGGITVRTTVSSNGFKIYEVHPGE
jgi:glycosidase